MHHGKGQSSVERRPTRQGAGAYYCAKGADLAVGGLEATVCPREPTLARA